MRRLAFVAFFLVGLVVASTPVLSQYREARYMPPTPESLAYGDTVDIVNNNGGYVDVFLKDVERLRKTNVKVRIIGKCNSACTLYLSLPKEQVCAYGNVTFAFHKPYGGSQNDYWKRRMLETYPNWVLNWLRREGGLTSTLKVMGPKDFFNYIPRCV